MFSKLRLFLETAFLGIMLYTFTGLSTHIYEDPKQDKKLVSDQIMNVMQQNRVVVECEDKHGQLWGGQGTIINEDQTGVWILTADHVAAGSTRCDTMFRDKSTHTAHVSWESDTADAAILFASRASWPTHAAIEKLVLGEKEYVFGEIKSEYVVDSSGMVVLGFGFTFNDTLYQGKSISRVPEQLMFGYPANRYNLVLTNLYSAPGSSGGAVFNEKGNVVGLVSGGSASDHFITYIVDVLQSLEESSK
jgi:S1-C subfamily serine protease